MVKLHSSVESRPHHHLLRAAYSLLANTAITSALGLIFWVLAARLYSSVTVGRDTVLLSTMVELSTLCQLNLGNGIVRFLPDLDRHGARAVGAAYASATTAAVVIGVGFVLIGPALSRELAYLRASPTLAIAFVAALAFWGIFTLQDAVLVATRRAPWIPLENSVFGILKLAVLPALLLIGSSNGIFVAWILPMSLLVIPINLLVFRRAIPEHRVGARRTSSLARLGTRRVASFLAQDYLSSVFTQTTLTILPLIVITTLGAHQSAYFAMPFTIVAAFDTLAYSACASLVVEGTLDEGNLTSLVAVFTRKILVMVLLAAALLILAAPLLMRLFGTAYAQHGTTVLRLMLCASVFRAGTALFSAIARVRGQGTVLAVIEFSLLTLIVGGTLLATSFGGIAAIASAWLGANAIVCLTLVPVLFRFLHKPQASENSVRYAAAPRASDY